MQVWLVRHAEAIEPDEFNGPDRKRPLTGPGLEKAGRGFRTLARMVAQPDRVYCSEAVRARQTADLLCAAFGLGQPRVTRLLNPGFGVEEFRRLRNDLPKKTRRVMLVGHEPDLSILVARLVSRGSLRLRVKKGDCIELEMERNGPAELVAHLPMKLMAS